jgi:hypothetical protein
MHVYVLCTFILQAEENNEILEREELDCDDSDMNQQPLTITSKNFFTSQICCFEQIQKFETVDNGILKPVFISLSGG